MNIVCFKEPVYKVTELSWKKRIFLYFERSIGRYVSIKMQKNSSPPPSSVDFVNRLKEYCVVCLYVLVACWAVLHPEWVAAAGGDDPFATSKTKAIEVFTKARDIILVLGGIGILAMAVMAFFGKFRWVWMLSLIAGLVMVLISSSFIHFFSGQQVALDGATGGQ